MRLNNSPRDRLVLNSECVLRWQRRHNSACIAVQRQQTPVPRRLQYLYAASEADNRSCARLMRSSSQRMLEANKSSGPSSRIRRIGGAVDAATIPALCTSPKRASDAPFHRRVLCLAIRLWENSAQREMSDVTRTGAWGRCGNNMEVPQNRHWGRHMGTEKRGPENV